MTTTGAVSTRSLNRALLARQLLLARAMVPLEEALGGLLALQAQLARPPFIALWSRLAGFQRETLLAAARERRVVRATMMRGTIHLLRADDYATLRPLLQPSFDAGARSLLKDWYGAADPAAVEREARTFFESPATFDAYRKHVLALRPGDNERAPAYHARMRLPLVQVPNGSPWGWPSSAEFVSAERWLGRAVATEGGDAAALVRRYLAAFGPTTVADAQCWTGLGGLRATVDAMRDELVVLRDERGRELFDLPEAPRPPEDVPAPVRFLPEFDNAILGHDDRSRIVDEEHRPRLVTKNLQVPATVLVDGRVWGSWRVTATRTRATLAVAPFGKPPTKRLRAELEREGEALLEFSEPESRTREVRWGAG
ncbi:MAG TPA: winged helix DNA-binding domain-containing protein [Gemmatimonadaceae bacterium]|nr:winged helix DNA-binding domain-containing protein [Gemmatimonadaceae bacterium]